MFWLSGKNTLFPPPPPFFNRPTLPSPTPACLATLGERVLYTKTLSPKKLKKTKKVAHKARICLMKLGEHGIARCDGSDYASPRGQNKINNQTHKTERNRTSNLVDIVSADPGKHLLWSDTSFKHKYRAHFLARGQVSGTFFGRIFLGRTQTVRAHFSGTSAASSGTFFGRKSKVHENAAKTRCARKFRAQ